MSYGSLLTAILSALTGDAHGASPTLYAKTLTSANTEYSQALPASCKRELTMLYPTVTPLELTALTWDFNFTANGDGYIRANEAMTVALGGTIGTGTLAYAKSTAGAPSTFNSTTLPTTLEAGAFLKVTASGVSGFLATQVKRTA